MTYVDRQAWFERCAQGVRDAEREVVQLEGFCRKAKCARTRAAILLRRNEAVKNMNDWQSRYDAVRASL